MSIGSTQHLGGPPAAWAAQTLVLPSPPDRGRWVCHATHGRLPSSRGLDAAAGSGTCLPTCLPTVCRSAALGGPPAASAAQTLVRPSPADRGRRIWHARHGALIVFRASDPAGSPGTCLATVCRSAAFGGSPAAWAAQTLVRPSPSDRGRWVCHANHGPSPSIRG